MKNRKILICVWLTLSLIGSSGIYSAPIDEFFSDEIVSKAVVQIGDMDQSEIEYFVDYLASCTANTKSETQQFHCEKDRTLFEIKYIKQNELRSLISALSVIETRTKQLSDSSVSFKERKELTKLFLRSSEVNRKLREAATIYYGIVNSENNR